jgi:2'-5' RNA ligase
MGPNEMRPMIRLFAALAIPPDIGAALSRRQTGIKDARWRTLESLHITLRFFGEIREDQADDLDLELAAVRGEVLSLTLQGVGAFGERDGAHAVWAGVRPEPAIERLARRCEIAARRAGLRPDTRVYRPHVTLAYLRRPDAAEVGAWIQAHSLLSSPPFVTRRFGLYASQATGEGSRYQLERLYTLTSAAA